MLSLLPDKLEFVFNTTYLRKLPVGDSECGTLNVSALSDNLVEGTEAFTVTVHRLDTSVTIFIIDNDCKYRCIKGGLL